MFADDREDRSFVYLCESVYGSSDKYLARLIALANCLWYLALVPVILLGTILPVSEIYCFRTSMSL